MTIRRKNDNEKTGMGSQNNPNHKLEEKKWSKTDSL